MKKPVILSMGEVLWDRFADGERFGGAPANFACHAAIRGAEVAMISAVGDDERGRKVFDQFRELGVDLGLMQVVPDTPTGTVTVELDLQGKPSFTIHQGVAWDRIAWNSNLERRVPQADAIGFGTLGQRSPASRETIRRSLQAAKSAGIVRMVDINLRPPFYDEPMICDSIGLANILKLSDDELSVVCEACGVSLRGSEEDQLDRLRESQKLDLVVMTRGARGAMLACSRGVMHQPGISVTVVDTVGAGDAFSASFLIGLLRGDPHEVILRQACEYAATVCTHPGAVPSMRRI